MTKAEQAAADLAAGQAPQGATTPTVNPTLRTESAGIIGVKSVIAQKGKNVGKRMFIIRTDSGKQVWERGEFPQGAKRVTYDVKQGTDGEYYDVAGYDVIASDKQGDALRLMAELGMTNAVVLPS